MADKLERVSVNVEAAIAQRLHLEAELIRERASVVDQQYRELLADASRAQDPNERARLQRLAEHTRTQRERLRAQSVATSELARKAVLDAKSLPDDTNPANLEPTTIVPFTKEETERHREEANTIAWQQLRDDRDQLLRETDWRVLPDSPLTDKARDAWVEYRAKLRDLPTKTTNPAKAKWPSEPGKG